MKINPHIRVPLPAEWASALPTAAARNGKDVARWTFTASAFLPAGWDGLEYDDPASAPPARRVALFEYGVAIHVAIVVGADTDRPVADVAARILASILHPCGLVCGGRAGFSVPSPWRSDAGTVRNVQSVPTSGPLSLPAHSSN